MYRHNIRYVNGERNNISKEYVKVLCILLLCKCRIDGWEGKLCKVLY